MDEDRRRGGPGREGRGLCGCRRPEAGRLHPRAASAGYARGQRRGPDWQPARRNQVLRSTAEPAFPLARDTVPTGRADVHGRHRNPLGRQAPGGPGEEGLLQNYARAGRQTGGARERRLGPAPETGGALEGHPHPRRRGRAAPQCGSVVRLQAWV